MFTDLIYHIPKDSNFDLAEVEIEPRAAGRQSSALPFELHDLIVFNSCLDWDRAGFRSVMSLVNMVYDLECLNRKHFPRKQKGKICKSDNSEMSAKQAHKIVIEGV